MLVFYPKEEISYDLQKKNCFIIKKLDVSK